MNFRIWNLILCKILKITFIFKTHFYSSLDTFVVDLSDQTRSRIAFFELKLANESNVNSNRCIIVLNGEFSENKNTKIESNFLI